MAQGSFSLPEATARGQGGRKATSQGWQEAWGQSWDKQLAVRLAKRDFPSGAGVEPLDDHFRDPRYVCAHCVCWECARRSKYHVRFGEDGGLCNVLHSVQFGQINKQPTLEVLRASGPPPKAQHDNKTINLVLFF